ncbi:MAG: ComF family protein [Candidatus Dojkabacteria bacterium]
MHNSSLDSIYVSWEYNSLTSKILKRYKYSYVYDIADTLSDFFIDTIGKSSYIDILKDSLIITVPLSTNRMRERGFNQVSKIAMNFCSRFNLEFNDSLVFKIGETEHQSLKDKDSRKEISNKSYIFINNVDLSKYKSITIMDDVITTGATIESVSSCIKESVGENFPVNGICLFRGKPNYSPLLVSS